MSGAFPNDSYVYQLQMLFRWFLATFECQDQDQDQEQARASPRSMQAHVRLRPMAWLRPFWEFRVPQSFTTI